jgi:hypothetical protein
MIDIYNMITGSTRDFKIGEIAIVSNPDQCHLDKECAADYPIGTIVRIVSVMPGYYECIALWDPEDEGYGYSDHELQKPKKAYSSKEYKIEAALET